MFLNTLSGRFLILTTIFVMLAEILIFVPSVARFREDYLMLRLERAQIASLALLAAEDMIDMELEEELLLNAEVYNVVLRRDQFRQLVLSSPIPGPVEGTFDLRDPSAWELIRDAIGCLLDPTDMVIRVIGEPVRGGGILIEITMQSGPLRAALIDYGLRILALSFAISAMTAILLFMSVRRLLVSPIKRVVSHMQSYAAAPEDSRRIIDPDSRVIELREAEDALKSLQTQLTGLLRQKERLAQLGGAVAKISHDLRNILTSAQLFADRIETSGDPMVARAAPKLLNSIARAVSLCESTLAFGKAEEPPPALSRFPVAEIVDDVVEGEQLASAETQVGFVQNIPPNQIVRADPEQLHRVLSNLMRNARQAIAATGAPGEIEVTAGEDDTVWWIRVADTGPGLPPKAREFLFQPFQGGQRKGGTGLGLAIAAELIRGHGGRLTLDTSGPEGTVFCITLPKANAVLDAAAE